MADASTTRSTLAYASLIAAIVIPQVQKHYGVALTLDDIADGMAALALAWHAVSSFIESRWPAKTSQDPAVIEAVTRAVLADLKSTPPFVTSQSQEKSP